MIYRRLLAAAAILILAGCAGDTHHYILISTADQKMVVFRDHKEIAVYDVSTSKFGLGDKPGSDETPLGLLCVKRKIGDNVPSGGVFKCRQFTGEVLRPNAPGRDPIVTRIIWLQGLEDRNRHAYGRYIYIHGTPEEWKLGQPASFGCIRMKSTDIIALYDIVGCGAKVRITTAPLNPPAAAAGRAHSHAVAVNSIPVSGWRCWTRPERRIFLALFLAGLAWNLAILLLSDGWSLDDELSHYLRSRSVWQNPALIFDVWTRTGRNLFHLLPATFGLTAARLWTLAFAALAVWITTVLAGRLGVRRAWLIPAVIWFQPWFVELSWGVLTQTPFLLFLLLGVWLLVERRWALSGLCIGYLPLVRHEGIALLGLWGVIMLVFAIARRTIAWRSLLWAGLAAVLPLAIYNMAAWLCLGELPAAVFFQPKPTEIYGHGTPWHFAAVSFVPAGIFTVALAALGLPRAFRAWRETWPLIFYPAYFGLHTVIFWFGLFASAGYYHFLMPLAPGLAILALMGLNACDEAGWKRTAWAMFAGSILQGLILFHVHSMQCWTHSPVTLGLSRDPVTQAIQSALDWQAANRPHAPLVECKHVYAAYARDWIESPERNRLHALLPAAMPTGAIVIWESKYSDLAGFTRDRFTEPDWKEDATFDHGAVRIFEKTTQ